MEKLLHKRKKLDARTLVTGEFAVWSFPRKSRHVGAQMDNPTDEFLNCPFHGACAKRLLNATSDFAWKPAEVVALLGAKGDRIISVVVDPLELRCILENGYEVAMCRSSRKPQSAV